MFKRVEKRRRKQEEEDELGLDDNMKEVLGMNDTDSDESDSDSDDSSEEEKVEQEQDEEEADVDEDEDEDSSDDEDEGDEPPISVEEALKDPVYIVSLQPDVKACIACPGRVLKSAEVVSVHRASKAHDRRFRQFASLAQSMKAAPDSNAWDLMKLKAQKKAEPSATPRVLSKRSQKRESTKAKMALRREKKREKRLKEKTKTKAAPEGAEPLTKKRKLNKGASGETDSASTDLVAKPPKPLKTRSPRNDRLEKQGKLGAKLARSHEPPGGRGKGNGKKGFGERGKKGFEERGKKPRRNDMTSDKSAPLQIFD